MQEHDEVLGLRVTELKLAFEAVGIGGQLAGIEQRMSLVGVS